VIEEGQKDGFQVSTRRGRTCSKDSVSYVVHIARGTAASIDRVTGRPGDVPIKKPSRYRDLFDTTHARLTYQASRHCDTDMHRYRYPRAQVHALTGTQNRQCIQRNVDCCRVQLEKEAPHLVPVVSTTRDTWVGTPSRTRVFKEPFTEEVTDPSAALATAPTWFAPLPLQEPQPVAHSTLRWGHAQDAHASGATRLRTCTRSRRWPRCHRWHAPKTPTPRGKGHVREPRRD
jgi:hypothetical protein